ncbi:hypothetical protein DKM19_22400 [Streptosporangium sp. 'caverna']|nr:hypothetical protein DKM19_22400 [Streptosporangium sp. 'caverna']
MPARTLRSSRVMDRDSLVTMDSVPIYGGLVGRASRIVLAHDLARGKLHRVTCGNRHLTTD